MAWGSALAAPFAYVPNEGSGTLSVIDTATDQVVGEIPAGKKPRGLAVSLDGARLYVSDQPNNRLVVVDLALRKAVGTVPLGVSPEGVSASPDGRYIAVALEESNSVAFIAAATGTEAFTVKVEGKNPEHAVFSPDGKLVYVGAEDAEQVDVIDVGKRRQVARIAVGRRPRGIGFLPDGSRAFIACEISSEVHVVDVARSQSVAVVKAGNFTNGIAVRPDGKVVYVSNGRDGTVSAIDTASNRIVATIATGARPWNMAITPDGRKLYVANGRSNSVSVIDTATHTKLRDIAVGGLPWGVIIPRLPLAQGARQPGADAVVVSATRVDQPSLEIPASIDRLYGEDLREGRPQVNLSESLGRVPGIVVLNRQNYAQDLQISSRGFGARATFGVRGIRLIADGIPATMPDGQGQSATFALGSASRVEVLRGPFSSLYGNASGGVINVITEDGPAVPTLEAGLYAGSYDTWRSALKFGGQWGALNAIGDLSRFSTDGYRDHSATVREQLNAKAKVEIGSGTTLTLVANSLRQPDTQDPLGLTRAQVLQNPQQATATAITFNTRKTIEHDQAGATLDHALSAATRLQASAWTGSRFVEQFLAIPLLATAQLSPTHSGGVVNLDRGFGGAALRVFSDAQLGGKALRLSAGVEYERMDERRRGYLNNNGVQGTLKRDEDNVVSSTDLFAQAEWKIAERWSAHAGLRSSRVEFTSEDHFIAAGNPDDSGARSYSATTPVAGVVYKLDPTSSLYANLGRGFETPTFVELSYRNPPATGLNFALEPSRSRHLEVGYKTVKPGVARGSLALFDVETRDEIVIDQSSGGRATFKNAGRTQRRGFELGAESLLPGPFEARAALTYLSAEFRDGFATVTGTPAVPATVAAGNVLPAVPKNQFYAEAAWRHAPTGFRAGAELLYRDRVAVNDINSEFADAFTVLNLVFGFQQQGAKWRLSEFLRVDNVTDKNYIGSVVVNDANGRYYEPAPQRSILLGVQASLKF